MSNWTAASEPLEAVNRVLLVLQVSPLVPLVMVNRLLVWADLVMVDSLAGRDRVEIGREDLSLADADDENFRLLPLLVAIEDDRL